MNQRSLVAVVSVILFSAGSAVAETHYVSTMSPIEIPPFTDVSQASHTIQPAINVAHNGDTVMVMVSTYNLTDQLVVTNGIVLRSSIDRDVILDGQDNDYRVLYISHTGAVVSGFTIKNGNNKVGDSGGGVFISTGKLVNCWVVSNSTGQEAGGVLIKGEGEVANCQIDNNRGDMFGGGVCCRDGGLVTNCVIFNNGVHGGWGGGVACLNAGAVVYSSISNNWGHTQGGGVYADHDGFVDRCTINCNTSENGGGVWLESGAAMDRCLVVNNICSNYGGGVHIYQGGTITNSRIFANVASNGGGVYIEQGGEVANSQISSNVAIGVYPNAGKGGGVHMNQSGNLRRCTVADNVANDRGGGVYMASVGNVESSVIQGNWAAYYGGGVDCDQGGNVSSCTIYGNTAQFTSGGGLHVNNGGYILGTIIWGNTAPSSPNVLEDGSGFQFYYCCTPSVLSVGEDNITDDPQFHSSSDLRLTSGSFCIDAGGSVHLPDRRGVPRALEGNRDEPAYDDIGAYEYIDPAWDTDGDGSSDRTEAWMGTDPTDPDSYTKMVRPAGIGFEWSSVAGKKYVVKRSMNLLSPNCGFTEAVESNIVATPPFNVYTGVVLSGSGPWFQRVELEDSGDVGPFDD